MKAKLYRVPISGSPFNAAIYVAAHTRHEAYNKAVKFNTAPPLLYGTAEVEAAFVSGNCDGFHPVDFQLMELQEIEEVMEKGFCR